MVRWSLSVLLSVLVCALSFLAVVPGPISAASGPPKGVPTGAVKGTAGAPKDGDKFVVTLDEDQDGDGVREPQTVLLLLTDAPEPGECYHDQSEAHLRKLMPPDATVYLVGDPATDDHDGKDRLLRHAYIQGKDDGDDWRSLNLTVIEDGYAGYREMGDATLHQAEYRDATVKAKREDRGLWGQCGSELHSDRVPADATSTPKPRQTATARTTVRSTATTASVSITDCSPFASYDEAQTYYAQHPDAQAIIDPNADGYACEVYFGIDPTGGAVGDAGGATGGDGGAVGVGAPAAPADTNGGGYTGGDYDCADFGSQAEAQGAWESAGGNAGNNVWGLDRDHNGVACESLP